MLVAAVIGRIRHIEVSGACVLKHSGRIGDFLRLYKAEPCSLYMGIGTIDTLEGASPFRLDIEDASPFQIKRCIGMIRENAAREWLRPGFRELNRTVSCYNTGKTGNTSIPFQCLKKELEPFSLAYDAKISIEQHNQFAGQDGKPAASQDDHSLRMPTDDTDQFPDFTYKGLHIGIVDIIDVSD